MSSNVPALSKGVTRLENAIVTLSGPALATSGIIAGVDILTNNLIARYAPSAGAIAGLVWAICLMLTLDFQVLMLGVRARRIYASRTKDGWQKFGELALCVAIAAALGYVSLQMGSIFARMLGTNLTIVQAQADLGINPIALIYERSALVLVLIFISGWLRDDVPADDHSTAQQPQDASTMSVTPDEIRSMIVDALTSVRVSVAPVDTLQIASHSTVVSNDDEDEQAQQAIEQPEKPDRGLTQSSTDAPIEPGRGEQINGYGDAIEALLRIEPGLSSRDVAERVGCSVSTSNKWMQRLRTPAVRSEQE